MVVRRQIVIIDDQEVEVPVFDTKIIPGKEIDTDIMDKISKEEEIEKKIQEAVKKIRIMRTRYKNIFKNTDYFFAVGRVLQFIDKDDYFKKQKGKIWQRMARDLSPDLFLYDVKKKIGESKRYPEFMYLISKIPIRFIRVASWDQWYEIMKFKKIYEKQQLLQKILQECKFIGAGPILRNKIKELIKNYEKR